MYLKISSDEGVCFKYLPSITHELSIEANSVGPEQTAPIGAVCSCADPGIFVRGVQVSLSVCVCVFFLFFFCFFSPQLILQKSNGHK